MLYTLSIAGENAVRFERQGYLLNVMIRIVLEFAGSPRDMVGDLHTHGYWYVKA